MRTVADVLTGEDLPQVDYEEVRGMEYTREAELEIAGKKIKIAVVHTLKSAMEMLERVKNGTADYQFIEVMACLADASAAAGSLFRLMPKSGNCAERDSLIVTEPMSYENRTKILK